MTNVCDLDTTFASEKEVKFVFDDELLVCQDPASECMNGYLWAMEYLVNALKAQEGKHTCEEYLNAMENISFYADYNVHTGAVSVTGNYDAFDIHVNFNLPISDQDKAEIIEALEAYCKSTHGQTCLEAIDEARKEAGLGSLAGIMALEDKLRNAETIEYKGIVFDDWTIDQEYGNVYGEMCQCCADKHTDLLKEELSAGGMGACSVKGCSVVGADSDYDRHYYIDFKPELIKVIERKPSLSVLCENAESRRNTPYNSHNQTPNKESAR